MNPNKTYCVKINSKTIVVQSGDIESKKLLQFPDRKREKIIGRTRYTLFIDKKGRGQLWASEYTGVIRTSPPKTLLLDDGSKDAIEQFEKAHEYEEPNWDEVDIS